ncbi:uncharacterized protein ARMOST_21783 [Armillaria ostoyae]|uniref:Uncharacterized protein n=1 Tax=Armillaria ostoyae TaxID=47428 RepID=A0A284SB39_ARMOS|nr:uncharacterized protein ARMOST_21783 [Armillaria ostoyae]
MSSPLQLRSERGCADPDYGSDSSMDSLFGGTDDDAPLPPSVGRDPSDLVDMELQAEDPGHSSESSMTSLFGRLDDSAPLFSSDEKDDGVEESSFEDNVNGGVRDCEFSGSNMEADEIELSLEGKSFEEATLNDNMDLHGLDSHCGPNNESGVIDTVLPSFGHDTSDLVKELQAGNPVGEATQHGPLPQPIKYHLRARVSGSNPQISKDSGISITSPEGKSDEPEAHAAGSHSLSDSEGSIDLLDGYETDISYTDCGRPTSQHSISKKVTGRGPRLKKVVIPPRAPEKNGSYFSFGKGFKCPDNDHMAHPSSCRVLDSFNLIYSDKLNAIVCPSLYGGCIIPANLLVKHMKHHHASDLQTRFGGSLISRAEWDAIFEHVTTSHGIDSQQSSKTILSALPSTISDPVPVMGGVPNKSVVDWFFKCPECFYFGLVAAKEKRKETNIARHFRMFHRAQSARKPLYGAPVKVQKLQILSGSGPSTSIFLCITNTSTNTGRIVNPNPPAPTYPNFEFEHVEEKVSEGPWLDKLGWPSYMTLLGDEASIDVLRGLVLLPTRQSSQNKGSIEQGLHVLYAECVHYFQAATSYLEKCTPQVRSEITKGSKRKFSDIVATTILKYRRPIFSTLALMVRYMEAKESNNLLGLGNFALRGAKNQLQCAADLYKFLLASEGKPNLTQLLELMHAAFDALVRPSEDLSSMLIACPTDQALLLMSLAGPGQYITAKSLASECAALQWTFQAIIVHVARLRFMNIAKFLSWPPHINSSSDIETTQPSVDDSDSDSENDTSSDEEDSLPSDMEGIGLLEESDILLNQERSNPNTGDQGSEATNMQITQYIHQEVKKWLSNEVMQDTPFRRLKMVIYNTAIAARKTETGSSSLHVTHDGQTYMIRDSFTEPLIIQMTRWLSLCQDLCKEVLPAKIMQMLQISKSTFGCDDFNVDILSDNFSPEAIHKQPQNALHLQQFQDSMANRLKMEGKATLEKWFSTEQEILACIAVIFHLTAGPSFRSFQFGTLQYDSSPQYGKRNLYFLAGPNRRQFILANPKAKQINVSLADTLLAFPEMITQLLAIYFCILRPVGMQLVVLSLRVPLSISVAITSYSAFIWAPSIKQSGKFSRNWWKGPEIDAALIEYTLNSFQIQVTGAILRQTSHAVFREKFPSLFVGSQYSATAIVSSIQEGELREYTAGLHFPAFENMDQAECGSRLLVSDIWHAALGLSQPSDLWRRVVSGSHLFATTEFCILALQHTRFIVAELSADMEKFWRYLAWLRQGEDDPMEGLDVNGAEILETKLVCEVTHDILFGPESPRLHSTPPLGGLNVDDVAYAAFLVEYVLVADQEYENDSKGLMSKAYLLVEHRKAMGKLKDAKTQLWIEFSARVYSLRHEGVYVETGNVTNAAMELLGLY